MVLTFSGPGAVVRRLGDRGSVGLLAVSVVGDGGVVRGNLRDASAVDPAVTRLR
jgi:hypothetical protein